MKEVDIFCLWNGCSGTELDLKIWESEKLIKSKKIPYDDFPCKKINSDMILVYQIEKLLKK